MKIALAQLNFHTGNFEANTAKICAAIEQAKNNSAELIIFSELAVCGYPPRDFLEFDDFINQCNESINVIARHCDNIAAIVGAPTVNSNPEGKRLYNSAYVLFEKKVMAVRHKTLLPTYDIFDEYRYFEPNKIFEPVNYKNHKIALTICEDLWNLDNKLYTTNPMDELIKHKPDFIVNISASPFSYLHDKERKSVYKNNCLKYRLPLFYVNLVGAQTELLFDGGSFVITPKGELLGELIFFEEDIKYFDLQDITSSSNNKFSYKEHKETNLNKADFSTINYKVVHDAIVMGIKDYFKKLGFKQAILGLSGGIDSAVTLALAVNALGKDNVKAILLPSEFTSENSVSDAQTLASRLEVKYETYSIQKVYEEFKRTLEKDLLTKSITITEENIQARCRGVILMALSNKYGYILLNTSNKSEIAVGYGTLYGDMCGGLAVLGDVYKTQIYGLVKYINKNKEIIPQSVVLKPPTAELRPNQKDSDSLPEYEILDKILFQYIELRKGPREIIEMGFEEQLVKKVLKLVNTNEYKRHQTPPILRISGKAFGMGRRMPIVAKYLA